MKKISTLMQNLRPILFALAASLSAVVFAAPPQLTQQVPGFYRQQVGKFIITALYDGYVKLDPQWLKGVSANDLQSLVARMFQTTDNGGIQTAVNAFLVHTGERLLLFDAGAAKCFGPTLGHIADNVRAAGYSPTDVDSVLLTHLHPDHICGLRAADGKQAFPNATVWAQQQEADFWLDEKIAATVPEDKRPFFKMAVDSLAPYRAAGKFKTFAAGSPMFAGVNALPAHGHTPGHTSFLIESENGKLLLWGDIVHAHAVQMPHPEVSTEFDTGKEQAIKTRKTIFEQVARRGWLVGGAHMPFPGLGHVRKDADAYSWVPIEFGPTTGN